MVERDDAPAGSIRDAGLDIVDAVATAARGFHQRVEGGEALRNSDSEIVLHDALDFGERKRLDAILQPSQRVEIGSGQEIGAG